MNNNTKLKLTRPLIFFDLETTGTNILKDRIVEISLIKVFPDGERVEKCRRINPEMPIPPESTEVHKITDDDVKDCPTFRQIAKSLYALFSDADIAGYNSNKFDVPLLIEEFNRCGISFDVAKHRFIDVQNIFHKMEQRTLVAAYKFYCGKELEGAHSANADAMATYEVLLGQLDRYPELKGDVESLAEFSKSGKNIDLAGRFIYNSKDVPVVNFGKHKGKPIMEVLRVDPSFYTWMMQGEFSKNTRDVLTAFYAELRKEKDNQQRH